MCYSNSLTSKNVDLKKKYKKEVPPELAEEPMFHASGFQFPYWRVITQASHIQEMRWGLIPHWFKGDNPLDIASKTLNARSETAHEKASFKQSFGSKHCIIPSSGFFEYHTEGKKKTPYFIHPADAELFNMAGIYQEAVDVRTGEMIGTFSILTCEANEMMAEIHNIKKRMPVILKDEDVERWLNPDVRVAELLAPSSSKMLTAHPVDGKVIRSSEANTPKVQQPFKEQNFQQGSLF